MRRPSLRLVMACFMSMFIGVYIGINLSIVFDHSHHHHQDSLNNNNHLRSTTTAISNDALVKTWRDRAERSKRELSEAMEQIHKFEAKLQDCQRQPKDNDDSRQEQQVTNTRIGKSYSHVGNGNNNNNNNHDHPICQLLPIPTPSASALWHHHILDILNATRLPNDRKFKFHDFTAELLQIISPRLPRSVKTVSHDWKSLESAMTIGWKRYQYLQLPPTQRQTVPAPPRPLKILVMGGSLLVGTNCRKVLKELDLGSQMGLPNRDCTWSNRLGKFLNMYFGVDFDPKTQQTDSLLFDVTKVAMGGTNTATGSVILEYDLIPDNARNPDIIINAYATNDMHILTILEAQSQNSTLREKVFDMTQQFVRDVMERSSSSSSCDDQGGQPNSPPLLLHMDDYLGNEQRKIWDTTELSQGAQVLANYYGFASLSYADTIRDFVYGDTHESWFSANWWGETGTTFDREIHPGMGMHISATWVVVYNLLNLVTTYCSIPPLPEDPPNVTKYYDGAMGMPSLRHDVVQATGKPKPRPSGLPPVLTQDLLIEKVTELWKQDSIKRNSKTRTTASSATCDKDGTASKTMKCPFSWVSGLSLQQNNKTWIDEYFRNHASIWQGWKLGDDGGKIGFVPTPETTKNNTIVLDFVNVPQPIQSVTLFIMKSYGEKWQDSRLRVQTSLLRTATTTTTTTSNIWEILTEKEMVGFHDKNTSEMYTEAIELPILIERGFSLRIGAQLVGGKMFKLMGLAICS